MAKTTSSSRRRWFGISVVAIGALFSFMFISSGCKKQESASEQAGREAREAFEKSRDLLKEGLDKTKDITQEGLEKGSEAAKEGYEKSMEAAKDFQKGWNEGGK